MERERTNARCKDTVTTLQPERYIVHRCGPEQQGEIPDGTEKRLKVISTSSNKLASKSRVNIDGQIHDLQCRFVEHNHSELMLSLHALVLNQGGDGLSYSAKGRGPRAVPDPALD